MREVHKVPPTSRLLGLGTLGLPYDLSLWSNLEKESRGRTLSYPRGSLIYSPEMKADSFFVVMKGAVWLYGLSQEGRRILLARLGPGACLGEASFLGSETYGDFAQAVADSTVYVLGSREAECFLQGHPQICLLLFKFLGQRLKMAERRLESFAFRSVPQRLARIILLLPRNEEGEITGFSQGDLADIIGTYRETANHVLRQFADAGCIRLSRKSIAILNEDELLRRAGFN